MPYISKHERRIDIFPGKHFPKGDQYENLDPIELSKRVEEYGTNDVDIWVKNGVPVYVHYRRVLTTIDGELYLTSHVQNRDTEWKFRRES